MPEEDFHLPNHVRFQAHQILRCAQDDSIGRRLEGHPPHGCVMGACLDHLLEAVILSVAKDLLFLVCRLLAALSTD